MGLRNAISHGYGEIDMHIVWRIVSTELQQVVDALARLNHSEHA
ncbi:HepT-like ribonuclease domain-containing protein [Corynebacterium durum]